MSTVGTLKLLCRLPLTQDRSLHPVSLHPGVLALLFQGTKIEGRAVVILQWCVDTKHQDP